ncbi:MAG: helix-turn-helix domain-containing protein [Bdellovibrio sp.]
MEFIKVETSEQLAELVRSTRKEQKITAEDLAKFGDLSRYAVLKFENQKSDIKLSTLLKLLKFCGLELHIKVKRK